MLIDPGRLEQILVNLGEGTGRPATRVLLMSGFAQPILDSGGHLVPGVGLIDKPFSAPAPLEKLAQTIERGEED